LRNEGGKVTLAGAVIPAESGVVGLRTEETIKNIGKISTPGMLETDRVILGIIRNIAASET